MLKVIVGPMKAEKTGEIIRLIKRALIGKKEIIVLSPEIDSRTPGEILESRNGMKVNAHRLSSSVEIKQYITKNLDIVFIDEVHLWDEALVEEVCKIADADIDVICSGLDLNYMSAPFENTARLLALADEVEKLTSVCESCGCDDGRRTARYIDGKPSSYDSPLIIVDGQDGNVVYKTFCNKCYKKMGMFGIGGYPTKGIEFVVTNNEKIMNNAKN